MNTTDGYSPPFCGTLPEDKGLELTLAKKQHGRIKPEDQVDFLQIALEDMVRDVRRIRVMYDMKSVNQFPDTYEVSVLAHNAYKDTEKDMTFQDGWKLVATAVNRATLNGYFGAAFMNPERHQIVIAHRGTKPLKLGAVWTDAIGVLFNNWTEQMESACTFSKKVSLAAKAVENGLGLRFQFIFTGHSLGAWLAQITTFALKYLVFDDESQFQKARSMSESIHAHTVVFDSPGCRPMLMEMQDGFDVRHSGRSIDINQLDITTYLSAPNLFNTCNPHVGTLYRLKMDFSEMNPIQKYTLIYTLAVHAMAKIVRALDPIKGGALQEPELVADFPRLSIRKYLFSKIKIPLQIITKPYYLVKSMFVRKSIPLPEDDEWTSFFEWACHSNNYNPEVKTDDFINSVKNCHGYWPIRYQIQPVDSTRCSVNVFTLKELEFLKMYQTVRDYPMYHQTNVTFADVDESHRETLKANLKCFEIIDDYIARDDLDHFIPFVQQLLHWHPAMLEAIKGQMSKYKIAETIYRNESNRFLNSWEAKTRLDYKDNKLEHYWKKQVWLVIAKEAKEMRTITQRVHSSYRSIIENKTDCIVLELEQLLYINDSFVGLKDFVKFEEMFSHLFLIECQQMDDLHDKACNMLESILDDLKDKPEVRFIFITTDGGNLSEFLQQNYKERLGDAFLTIREEIEPSWDDLTQVSMDDLYERKLIIFNGERYTSLEDLVNVKEEMGKIIDCTSLSKFLNEEVAVGTKPWSLHSMKATSIDLYEEIQSQQLTGMLERSDDKTIFLFSFSGNENDDVLKKHITNGKKINRIYSTIGWDSESNWKKWKDLCHDNQSKLLYWFQVTSNKIHCKQVYNPNFYIPRQFKVDFKRVMKSDGLYVISYRELDRNAVHEMKQSYKDHFAIVMTEQEVEKCVKCLKKFVKSVYWIKADSNQNLKWHQSIGLHDFTDCVKKSYLDEKSLANVQDRIVIIAGEPGMGKSTTLTCLAEHLKEHWVIMRDLRSCEQQLKRMNDQHTITEDDAIKFLSESKNDGLSSDFARALLMCGLQGKTKKTLYLLFDGFDEIKDTVGQSFVKLILFLKKDCKCQIWITTRNNGKQVLEYQLSTVAVDMIEIGRDERKQFLEGIWRNKHKLSVQLNTTHLENLSAYTKKLLKKAAELLGSEKQRFLRSPLQLRMIAEAFCPDAETIAKPDSNDVDVEINDKVSLYQTFIKRKYDIYLEDKEGLISNACNAPKQWCTQYLAKKHKILAFRMMYPKEDIQHPYNYNEQDFKKDVQEMNQVGLIQSEYRDHKYDFIHGSIVDFFVAKLLANWLNKPAGRHERLAKLLMSPITAEQRSKGVRLFLDEILKNTPVNKESLVELCLPHIQAMCQTKEGTFIDNCSLILYIAAEEKLATVINILFDCFKQHPEALVSLISWRNEDGKTALYAAMEKGNDAIVNQLLNLVQDCSKTTQQELLYATCYRTSEESKNSVISKLMEKLESSGMKQISDAIKTKWPDISIFMNRARRGDIKKVGDLFSEDRKDGDPVFQKYLIAAVNKKQKTALHFAAMNGHEDIVTYLLEKGANANAKDHLHNTPLHFAAEKDHVEVVKRLMAYGADVSTKNQSSKTPLDIANRLTRKLMINEEANVMSKPELDKMLHQFCKEPQKTKEIIENSAPEREEFRRYVFSYRDKNNRTPLHIASLNGNVEAVNWLLSNKEIDLNAKDNWGVTPLRMAEKRGRRNVVDVLKSKEGKTESQLTTNNDIQKPLNNEYEQLNPVANVTQSNPVNQTDGNITLVDDLDAEILEMVAEAGHWRLAKKMVKRGVNIQNLTGEHRSNLLKYVTGNHKTDEINMENFKFQCGEIIAPMKSQMGKEILGQAGTEMNDEVKAQNHVSKKKMKAKKDVSIGNVIALNNVDLLNYMIYEIRKRSEKWMNADIDQAQTHPDDIEIPEIAVEWHNLSPKMRERLNEKPFSLILFRKPPNITFQKYDDGKLVLND